MTQAFNYVKTPQVLVTAPKFRPFYTEASHQCQVIDRDFKDHCCVSYNASCKQTLLQAKLPQLPQKVLADSNRFEFSRWTEFNDPARYTGSPLFAREWALNMIPVGD